MNNDMFSKAIEEALTDEYVKSIPKTEHHNYNIKSVWRKRFICLVAVFILISMIIVISVEALRTRVFNFFVDTFYIFSTVEYDNQNSTLPETLENLYNITYVNNTMVIYFYQQTKDTYNINYNTEDAIIEEIVVNDWNGIYFKDNHGYSNIILDVGDYIVSISANLPKEQGIEIFVQFYYLIKLYILKSRIKLPGDSKHNTWKIVSDNNGYYYLYSQLDDGSYVIFTKASKSNCCLQVMDTGSGVNIEQKTYTGQDNQIWILELISINELSPGAV